MFNSIICMFCSQEQEHTFALPCRNFNYYDLLQVQHDDDNDNCSKTRNKSLSYYMCVVCICIYFSPEAIRRTWLHEMFKRTVIFFWLMFFKPTSSHHQDIFTTGRQDRIHGTHFVICTYLPYTIQYIISQHKYIDCQKNECKH